MLFSWIEFIIGGFYVDSNIEVLMGWLICDVLYIGMLMYVKLNMRGLLMFLDFFVVLEVYFVGVWWFVGVGCC